MVIVIVILLIIVQVIQHVSYSRLSYVKISNLKSDGPKSHDRGLPYHVCISLFLSLSLYIYIYFICSFHIISYYLDYIMIYVNVSSRPKRPPGVADLGPSHGGWLRERAVCGEGFSEPWLRRGVYFSRRMNKLFNRFMAYNKHIQTFVWLSAGCGKGSMEPQLRRRVCVSMIGTADIEGSTSNVAMNAWLPQASHPCGNFSDTSSWTCLRPKGSIGYRLKTPHLFLFRYKPNTKYSCLFIT